MDYFILMADIVGSSGKNSKKLLQNFSGHVRTINAIFSKRLKSKLKISLGDEFQCVTNDLETAVEIIFAMNELILSLKKDYYKLRFTINFGKIETKISGSAPMLGQGLTDARKTLTQMKEKKQAYSINLGENLQEKTLLLNEMFQLYQHFFEAWKPKDYPMISAYLEGKNYAETAQLFRIDPSSAWRREKSLNISEYQISKNVILKIAKNDR